MSIPDLPPPSFQEAITTPVYRVQGIGMPDASSTSHYSIQKRPLVNSDPTAPTFSRTPHHGGAYHVNPAGVTHSLPRFFISETSNPFEYPPVEWEVERQHGTPLAERVWQEGERRERVEATHLSVIYSEPTELDILTARKSLLDKDLSVGEHAPRSAPVDPHNTPTTSVPEGGTCAPAFAALVRSTDYSLSPSS